MNADTIKPIADSWLGTPFRPHANVKGAGVDCVNLAIAIYREAGIPLEVTLPQYGMTDWRFRNGPGPCRLWLDACPLFACVWKTEDAVSMPALSTGDCLLIRVENSDHHLGIVVDDSQFVHAIRDYGVMFSAIYDATYLRRLVAVYRPKV